MIKVLMNGRTNCDKRGISSMKRIINIIVLLICAFTLYAQDIEVKKFEPMVKDQTAALSPRKDINGVICGLVKVLLKEPGAEFEGSVMGDVQFTGKEYLVYRIPADSDCSSCQGCTRQETRESVY